MVLFAVFEACSIEQRTVFHTHLLGEQKSASLVILPLGMKLDFVRDFGSKPGRAYDADFVTVQSQLGNVLDETDVVVDDRLAHEFPPCAQQEICTKDARNGRGSPTLANRLRPKSPFQSP